ncbi:hypothetical protein [Bradyrhizobium roseum]|uniref:hypothetical protein n=1 Tax=Bradyrhizobium roseum TaxID=3056648 RepID=UPI002605CE14|nr:hypothetical protein [Bradyrhizobium roseus]WKA25477.1 hypothetical protein QUH67_17705 [Bradyrhizobium roseus]
MAIVYKRDFVTSGKFLALLAVPLGLLALPLFVVAYLHLSIIFSPPAYSASVVIPELNTTIKLDFYWVWDETQESGRYLTVSTQQRSVRSQIGGSDWVHNARTSVYVTAERNIAVLGPMETDYVIDPRKVELNSLSPYASSVGWKYIGAFDIAGPTLQFFPASRQPECIPMPTSRDENWPKMSRAEYRKQNCYSRTTS